jgi:hypothetical protein
MPYNDQPMVLRHEFINEVRILEIFQAFRKYKYNVKRNRDTMRDLMLNAATIIQPGARFFEQGRYLDIDGTILGEQWQSLLNALDQEDRAIEAGRAQPSNDARVTYDKSIHVLKQAFRQVGPDPARDIFDRASFEAFHALVWVNPPQNPQE